MQLLDGQTLKIKFGRLIAEKRKAYNWSQEYLVEKLEDCPPEFLKFAKEHDLPIILMKPTRDDALDKKIK